MIQQSFLDDLKTVYEKIIPQRKIIDEYLVIVSQNKLLQDIKDQIVRRKYLPELGSTGSFVNKSNESQSNQPSIKNIFQEEDNTLKSKFSQQFQQSILDSALQEVKTNCSANTYDTIKKACQNNKAGQYLNLQKNYEKLKKENEDLMSSNMTQHKQKSNILWELNLLKPKIKSLDQQKAKIKRQMDQLMDKEQKLFKIEASLAFKQKISLEGRKRYQRQRQSALEAQTKLTEAVNQFEKLWRFIQNKSNSTDCAQHCWRKDVMKKCKDKIMQQRDALKAEQIQIQKQYQIMANLSAQFKKLFVNNQNNAK